MNKGTCSLRRGSIGKKEGRGERHQDVVEWDFISSILSCTVTPPYPLFPTAYFKKLVDNITIQQTKQNKHIIIILACPTFTIPLHRELQREKESPFIKFKKKSVFFHNQYSEMVPSLISSLCLCHCLST